MIRKLLSLVTLLIVLVVVGAVAAFFYIDSVAKTAIERGGSYVLGVPTTLDRADVGVFDGTFRMTGLTVANPTGFDGPPFLHLDDGGMAVSLATLREPTVELPAMTFTGLDLALDRRGGAANYRVILDNLKRFEGDDRSTSDAKRFIVREILIRDVNVRVSLEGLAASSLPIDEIRLRDVGAEANRGVVLDQLAHVIIKAILAAVAERGGGVIPGDVLGDLQNGLAQLESLQASGATMASDLRRQIDEKADALKDLGEEAGKTLEGIGEIFGGRKK